MGLLVSSFDEVQAEPLTWVWPGWIAAGTLHLLAGEAGTGKSGVLVNIAATISCGGIFPDRVSRAEKGEVLIYSSEDSTGVIKARLLAAGADLTAVVTVRGVQHGDGITRYYPGQHLQQLRNTLIEARPKLVILDPLTVFANGQGGAAVRTALEELADIARESGAAIIGITHFAKATGNRPAIERVLNSQAYTAVPRMVLITGMSAQTGEKVIVRAKSNISEAGGGYEYRVYSEDVALDGHSADTTMIAWGAGVEGSADDILRTGRVEDAIRPLGAAKSYLQSLLADGPLPMTTVMNHALHAGHSQKTVKRAKADLGIVSFWQGRVSLWRLPLSADEQTGQPAQQGHYLN